MNAFECVVIVFMILAVVFAYIVIKNFQRIDYWNDRQDQEIMRIKFPLGDAHE